MPDNNNNSTSKKRPAPSSSSSTAAAEDNNNNVDDTPVRRDALMDSLPYIDAAHEDYEQYALALIEQEMKSSKPPPPPPPPAAAADPSKFRTPEHEYQRFVASDGKPEPRDSQFFSSVFVANPPTTADDNDDDVEGWRIAVQQARSEYEAERVRSITLEVKRDAGAALLWKGFNGDLDKELEITQAALAEEREIVEQINLQRSDDQQRAGKQIHILTTQYQAALERRFQLQLATAALEKEIQQQQQSSQ